MIYYFYSKIDSSKEPVVKTKCESYEEALEYFSENKKLPKHVFLSLYEIKVEENDSKS